MVIQNDNKEVLMPLELAGCMVHFKHRVPKPGEIESLKHYCLTHDDTLWNPSILSDQIADKFYKQVCH
jgi:hypothetical protein